MVKCPSYEGFRLTIVSLIEIFPREIHLRSARTRGSVRLGEVSVLRGLTVVKSVDTLGFVRAIRPRVPNCFTLSLKLHYRIAYYKIFTL